MTLLKRKSSDSESSSDESSSEDEKTKKKKKRHAAKKVPKYEQEDFTSSAGFTQVGKGGKALEITPETVYARLRDVAEARGKKGTDRSEQIGILEKVLAVAGTPVQKVKTLLATISLRLDFNVGVSNYMLIEYWKAYFLFPS